MDGFKNTTKTSYDTTSGRKFANGGMTVSRADMPGGEGPMNKPALVAKYAKGGHVKKGEQKIGRVMEEFTKGKLHSGSKEGPKVKSTKQAVAIALNEARAAGAKIPRVKKRNEGTPMGKGPERGMGAMTDREMKMLRSAEADDVLAARMTRDEMAMGSKGIRMARERMARERARGAGAMTDKEMRVMQKEAIKPMQPKKALPATSREPMYGPAKRLSIPLSKGGLSVMPKGKGC
jgi:hypothetical protein